MRRAHWPAEEETVRTVVRGPDALTVAGVGAIDVMHGRAMAGRRGVRWGDPSAPALRLTGYGPALQDFAGARLHTSAGSHVAGPNQALPATTTPTGATNEVLELLRRTRR